MAAPSRFDIKSPNWGTQTVTTNEVEPPETAKGKAYQVHTEAGVLLGTVVKEAKWVAVPLYGNRSEADTRQEAIEALVHTSLGREV